MSTKKDIKLSININKIDEQMIEFLVNHFNMYSLSTYRKTTLLRDLIYKEFVEVNKEVFDELNIDTKNQIEVLKASQELDLIKI